MRAGGGDVPPQNVTVRGVPQRGLMPGPLAVPNGSCLLLGPILSLYVARHACLFLEVLPFTKSMSASPSLLEKGGVGRADTARFSVVPGAGEHRRASVEPERAGERGGWTPREQKGGRLPCALRGRMGAGDVGVPLYPLSHN